MAALRTGTYDVLVTDMMMPTLDGIGLLRAGLEIDPNLIGLIMTGKGTVITAVEALKLGAFDYILKPFNLQTILLSLQRGLELRRVRLENLQLRESVALYDLSQAVSTTLDAETVARLTAGAARQQLGADEAAVLRLAPDGQSLVVAALATAGPEAAAANPAAPAAGHNGHEPGASRLGQHLPLTAGLAGWFGEHAEPLAVVSPADDPRCRPLFPRSETSAAIVMPMIAAGRVAGLINRKRPQAAPAVHPRTGESPQHPGQRRGGGAGKCQPGGRAARQRGPLPRIDRACHRRHRHGQCPG